MDGRPCCHPCARIVTKVPSAKHFAPFRCVPDTRVEAQRTRRARDPRVLQWVKMEGEGRGARVTGGGASETENEGGETERRRGQAGEATGATSEALHNPPITR